MSCCEELAKKHEAAVGHFKTEIKKLNDRLTQLENKCATCPVAKSAPAPAPVPKAKAKAVPPPPKKKPNKPKPKKK